MNLRPLILGGAVGAAVGFLVASVMSFLDWRQNPAGLFHGELGTDWKIVLETAVSWFVPVFLLVAVLSAGIGWWISRRRNGSQGIGYGR